MKCARIQSYSGLYFPAFGLNTERYSVSLRIQCECGKIRIRITPNTDIFTQCKFALPYDYIYQIEQKFLETKSKKPLIWLKYIDDICFIWIHGEQELERFLKDLNNFTPNLTFTHEACKNYIPLVDLKVKVIHGKLETDLYIKPNDHHQYLHYLSSHPEHTKCSIVYRQ